MLRVANIASTSANSRTAVPMGRRAAVVMRASVTAEKASLEINTMVPLHDRILVKPIEEEEHTAGGILLPKGPPKANSDAHYGTAEVEIPEGELLFVAQKSVIGKAE
eukprot:gene1881-33300_t